jgi:hypothetical protein
LFWLAIQHLMHEVLEKRGLVPVHRSQQIAGVRTPFPDERRQLHPGPPALQACVHCLDIVFGKPKIHHVVEKGGHLLVGGTQLLG